MVLTRHAVRRGFLLEDADGQTRNLAPRQSALPLPRGSTSSHHRYDQPASILTASAQAMACARRPWAAASNSFPSQ